ncbi:MAG: lysophospholipid acyltransferase family protein [Syntrophales bacterium]|nr:lysophospholipid acyltransferase family protein [Syntrophales bacterium]
MIKHWTTKLTLKVMGMVPLRLRRFIFTILLRSFYHLSPKHRLITIHNLRRAFPEKPTKEIIRIAKGTYRHLGIVMADFFSIPAITKENLHNWVDFEGLEHVDKALEQGHGVLSLVAHFGNWELMTAAFPLTKVPLEIVYRPLDNSFLEDLFRTVRTLHGNNLIVNRGSGKIITRLLMKNRVIGILSDQNVSVQEGVFVDFFGRPACTSVGLAVLAMRTGSPVLPAFMPRMSDGRYRFILLEPVEIDNTGDYERDIFTNTQRFAKIIENMIRKYPEQWFWLHQRWKTRPCQK